MVGQETKILQSVNVSRESDTPPAFFEKVYCINLNKRTDRWAEVQPEFKKLGFHVERFEACEGENNHLAFNLSQYLVIKQAYESGARTCLILEDDVEFKNFLHYDRALQELPKDWDAIWLGANVNGQRLPKHSKYLRNIKGSFTTHAVGYSRKMMEWILENFNPNEFPIYDEWLRINVQEQFKCFLMAPMIAWQRPSFSDIWQNQADYTSCINDGNKLLEW